MSDFGYCCLCGREREIDGDRLCSPCGILEQWGLVIRGTGGRIRSVKGAAPWIGCFWD